MTKKKTTSTKRIGATELHRVLLYTRAVAMGFSDWKTVPASIKRQISLEIQGRG